MGPSHASELSLAFGLAAAPQSREVVCRSRDVDESHSLPPAPSHSPFKAETLFTLAPISLPTRRPWTDYRIDHLGLVVFAVCMRVLVCWFSFRNFTTKSHFSPLFPMLLFFQNRIAARPETDRTSQRCTKNSDHAERQVRGACVDIWLCGPHFTQWFFHVCDCGELCVRRFCLLTKSSSWMPLSFVLFSNHKWYTFDYIVFLRFFQICIHANFNNGYKVAFICVFIYFCISVTAPGLSWLIQLRCDSNSTQNGAEIQLVCPKSIPGIGSSNFLI